VPLQALRGEAIVFTVSRCPYVSCQHGLVRRVGESITNMEQWRDHMTIACMYF